MNIIMNQGYEPLALFSKNIIPCLLFICIRVFLCFYLQESVFPYGPRIERVFFLLSCHRAPTWPSLPPGTTQCATGRAFLIPHSVPAASCRYLFCLKTYTANNCGLRVLLCENCRGSRQEYVLSASYCYGIRIVFFLVPLSRQSLLFPVSQPPLPTFYPCRLQLGQTALC